MTPKSDAPRRIEVELPAEIFDVAVNVPLIHQVVVAQQAAARQGTASAKTRGEVRGGGRKPYKQKGTGRARQGSTRAPQFTGGGVAHGPKPRDYGQRTPKKMKAAALRGALSDRARANRVHVVEGLVSGPTPSTRAALAALRSLVERDKFLVVLERTDRLTWLSLRNAPSVHLLAVDQLNTYDVLASDDVVFTQGAYKVFVARDEAGREAAPQQATKRVAPQVEAPEVIDSPTSPTDHAAHILQAAHKAAECMDKVMSYRSDDASIDGWSVSSDKIEFVAIERHRDHVLVTWPTTMAAVDAIQFFKSLAAVAVYADGGDEYVEFSAGSKPDWDRIAELDELSFLRVDTGSEILIWEEPEEGHLRDNRFFLIEPAVLASDLLRLIDDTTIRDVAGLLGQFVDMAKLDLQPLVETG